MKTFELVNDTFNEEQANDIINDLIKFLLNFYGIQAWTIKERYNGDNTETYKKADEIKKMKEELNSMIKNGNTEEIPIKLKISLGNS